MRDTRKSKEYFDKYIDEENARVKKFEGMLERGEIKEKQVSEIKCSMEIFKYHIIIARFSRGDDINSLIDDYSAFISKMLELGQDGPYVYEVLLWMLSIGIMLEIDDTTFGIIADYTLRYVEDDWLLKYLIHYRKPEVIYQNSSLCLKKLCQRTRDVIESEAPEEAMKVCLSRWYQSNGSSYWYGSHKQNLDTYFGYWSFEAGAIVKIMGLDDSTFKDSPYYPYDMVHFKD